VVDVTTGTAGSDSGAPIRRVSADAEVDPLRIPDRFRVRHREVGFAKALLESFAYVRPFGPAFKKTAPFYAESYWYAMGGLTFLMFVYLTLSGIVMAWLAPYWWLTSPIGRFVKSTHYWAAQGFFFFMFLHVIRVWATGAYRGRRLLNWVLGIAMLLLAFGENLFGLLARGDWESQFVALHSGNMLFLEPFFFHLFGPGNFTADLTIHVALIPVILFGLIFAHIALVRMQGIAPPLGEPADPDEEPADGAR
jgi:quinol-cytochrome oxidoreductase complex cytochrome b subunit